MREFLDRQRLDCVDTQFGSYANFDSQGPKSAIPRPTIPLAYPVAVQVSQRHIYIADSANRRVVRVDVRWKAEAQ